MSTIRAIRDKLQVSQRVLAEAIGCTQANVTHYERGQTVPPEAAKKIVAFAKSRGVPLTTDQIYGLQPIEPNEPATVQEPRA